MRKKLLGLLFGWGMFALPSSVYCELSRKDDCEMKSALAANPLLQLRSHVELLVIRLRLIGKSDAEVDFDLSNLNPLLAERENKRQSAFAIYKERLSSEYQNFLTLLKNGFTHEALREILLANPELRALLEYLKADLSLSLEEARLEIQRSSELQRKRSFYALSLRAAKLENALKIIPDPERILKIQRLEVLLAQAEKSLNLLDPREIVELEDLHKRIVF